MLRLQFSKIPLQRLLRNNVFSSRSADLLRSQRLFNSRTKRFITVNPTNSLLQRRPVDPKSLMKDLDSENFNYTSGRFLANEAYHLSERRRIFSIPGLFDIIAKMMNCKTEQIVDFRKLAEGGLNRVFLVTLNTGSQLIARIPYPLCASKAYSVASEVATMDFLRSKGIPTPKVYAYSFTPNNDAETEYILMEYVKGTKLEKMWFDLKEDQIVPLMRQLVQYESTMMSIAFPAGGSIYYSKDLLELSGNTGIPLDAAQADGNALAGEAPERFCIGLDVSIRMWYGRREQLDVFRGPYENTESALTAGAKKELAYLNKFGTPRLPCNHFRRGCYHYEKQSPLDHVQNLQRYLSFVPLLASRDPSFDAFCIRHPDLSSSNIMVTTDPSGRPEILSFLDWQHTSVLPLFTLSGVPKFIEMSDDEFPDWAVKPKLPENFNMLSEENKESEQELLRRRLILFHYISSTEARNMYHLKCLVNRLNNLRRRMFTNASVIWEGETIDLLSALLDVAVDWEFFAMDGTSCPVDFTDEEVYKALELSKSLEDAANNEMLIRQHIGYAEDTWVPVGFYERSKVRGEDAKRQMLQECAEDEENTEEDCAVLDANWPLNDVHEDELEEYK